MDSSDVGVGGVFGVIGRELGEVAARRAIDDEVGGAMGLEHDVGTNFLVRIEDVGATFGGRRFRMTGDWLLQVGISQSGGPVVLMIRKPGE